MRASKYIFRANAEPVFFFCLFVISLFLSGPLNFPGGKPKGGTEFYADKAMYYVYLPATFIYHWDLKKFPESIDQKTRGFTLHYKNDKLIIKATCGVAVMLTPFFIPVHLIARAFDLQPDGFSIFYQRMMTIPALIYLALGLFFLKRFLEWYLPRKVTYFTILFLFLGTNLFFYSVDEGLMSHVYSFFLFSLTLFLLKKFLVAGKQSYSLFIWLCITVSLAVLIRPTNLVLLSLFLFLDASSFREIGRRFLFFIRPKYILVFILVLFLVMIPQMIYWHYLSGSYIYNSYPDEGFTNLGHPMILPLWFSPLNGFFLYTPMAIFFIAGIAMMIVDGKPNGIYFASLFLFMSLVFASWLCWFFGGSFGMRPFVEFYAIFSLPFGYFFAWMSGRRNLFIRSLYVVSILAFTWYNLRLTWNFHFFPGSIWSWDDYRISLTDAGIQHFPKKTYTYINDFENNTFPDEIPRNNKTVHSLTLSSSLDPSMEFNCKYSKRFDQILDQRPFKASAGIWFKSSGEKETGASFVCSIEDPAGKSLFYRSVNIDKFAKKRGEWTKAGEVFQFPEWIPLNSTISFYIWNIRRSSFYVDDMTFKFE
jgi:hypothetical protein